MRMHFYFLLSFFTAIRVYAQPETVKTEIKDQKFIYNNTSICLITKKEQEVSKEYISSRVENENYSQDVAMIILQMRLIENKDFQSIHCALRYFLERYYEKNSKNGGGFNGYGRYENSRIVDYTKYLEKLRIDPMYKDSFKKEILDSADMGFYYGPITQTTSNYSLLNEDFARKLFSENIIKKKSLGADEWRMIFILYYAKNQIPPDNLKEIMKADIQKNLPSGFLGMYILNANEAAYTDFFQIFFQKDEFVKEVLSNRNFSGNFTTSDIFNSSFLPETLKCKYATDVVAKLAPSLPESELETIKKIDSPCLKSAIADITKFVKPENSCPFIQFDKNENRPALISKMSSEFFSDWKKCRTKCETGDKCNFFPEVTGEYSFYNKKYSNDLPLLKEILNTNQSSNTRALSMKYDVNLNGICINNTCMEKVDNCDGNEVLKKIKKEIAQSNLLTCDQDSDCSVVQTDLINCTEFSINSKFTNNRTRVSPYEFEFGNFIRYRVQKMGESCRQRFFGDYLSCRTSNNKTSTAKCVKKVCTLENN